MLNVNELTSRMAKMSDAQLRQYAQLHKNDPYTLALAASESKRRAQLRASGQTQAPQQPTVADQALAQMGAPAPMPQQAQPQPQPQLPEQQGIGMLPAQNVEGMADGGIAGYDDQFVDSYADAYAHGGIVAFAGKDESLVRTPNFDLSGGTNTVYGTNTANVFRKSAAQPVVVAEETSSPIGRFFSNLLSGPAGARERYDEQQKRLEEERKLAAKLFELEGGGFKQQNKAQRAEADKVRKQLNELRSSPQPQLKAPEKKAGWAVEGKKVGEQGSAPPPIDEFAGVDLSQTGPFNIKTPAGRTAAAEAQVRSRAGNQKKEEKGAPPPPPTTEQKIQGPAFTPTASTDLSTELAKVKPLFGEVEKKYDDLLKANQEFYTGFQKEREATRPKGKAFEGLEGLLKKEEDQAKGKEARNFNMAIVNAGLAIAGGRSQYALQNIAEGAQVGSKQYQEGLEKLEAAAIERRKQNAMIEEARRAEARGDWKEDLALRQSIHNSNLAIRQNQIEGIAKITGESIKVAADVVNTATQMHSADLRAQMQQQAETAREEFKQRQENIRAEKRGVIDERVATIYANRPMGGGAGATRGAITPALAVREYNDMEAKDPMRIGPFFKQFPTQDSYYLYLKNLENPTVTNQVPANATIRK